MLLHRSLQLLAQGLLIDRQALGDFAQQQVAADRVADLGQQWSQGCDGAGFTLNTAKVVPKGELFEIEVEYRLGPLGSFEQCIGAVFLDEGIGIVFGGQRDDAGVEVGAQQYFKSAHGSGGTGCVSIEEEHDLMGIAG